MRACGLLLLLCFLSTGCRSTPVEPQADKVLRLAQPHLPEGAFGLRHEGGDWLSFSLTREGSTHRYLYRTWNGSHGEIGHTITRLD